MANRAQLYNLEKFNINLSDLSQNHYDSVVAEAAYRVPIPWLCCFRATDIYRVQVPQDPWDTKKPEFCSLLISSLDQAVMNPRDSRSFILQITAAGNTASRFVDKALKHLSALKKPYLAMNVYEIMIMGASEREFTLGLKSFISRPRSSLRAYQAHFGGYYQGVMPYSAEVLYNQRDRKSFNENRLHNTNALDMNWTLPHLPDGTPLLRW